MNDKDVAELQAKIQKCIDHWQTAGFGWWKTEVKFVNGYNNDDNRGVMAETWTSWEYRTASINFYLPAMEDKDDSEIERVVVHEYCHLLIDSISNNSNANNTKLSELACENVTRALLWSAELIPTLALAPKAKRSRKVGDKK